MPIVYTNGIDLSYDIYGSGFPVLFIIGFGDDSRDWKNQISDFSKKYTMIVYDLRGTGRSEKPKQGYSIRIFSEDARGLLSALGVDRAHIIGHSMGGRIAQDFAANFPEMVQSLTLAATSARANTFNLLCLRAASYLYKNHGPEAATVFGPMLNFSRGYLDNNFSGIAAKMGTIEGDFMPLDAFLGHARAIEEHDTRDQLGSIVAPTLVILGDQEGINPLGDSAFLVEHIKNAELQILKGAGHNLQIETAAAFNDVVLAFIERNGNGNKNEKL